MYFYFFSYFNFNLSAQNTNWIGLLVSQTFHHNYFCKITDFILLVKVFFSKGLYSFTFKPSLTFSFYNRRMIHILQPPFWFVCICPIDQISYLTHRRCRIVDRKKNNTQILEYQLCGHKPPQQRNKRKSPISPK